MDFAEATSWVGGGATATEAPSTPANPVQPETQPQEAPASEQNAQPAQPTSTPEDLTPYRDLVENLGGMDGVRQFNPLYKALATPSQDLTEVGRNVSKALKEVLGADHYGAMIMALHDEFGELLAEEFINQRPDWLQTKFAALRGQGQSQPSTEGDADDYGDPITPDPSQQSQMTPREKELIERLAKVEAELNKFNQASQQTAEQQFRANVEKEIFGTVVDKTFGQLQGWDDEDLKMVMRIAMNEFASDPKAKETFDLAANYLRTKQPLLANQVVRAQQAFQGHLKTALELVDLKRQAARKTQQPVEPERQEFSSAAGSPMNTQQPTTQMANQLWDPNVLLAAIKQRLGAGKAGVRA